MRLYHFLSQEFGLQALRNQTLKVSRFDNLNDPFELQAAGSKQRSVRKIIAKNKAAMAEKGRLLCCSKSYKSPVLWGHYADSHKGVALELDIPSKYVIDVEYVEERFELIESDLIEAFGKEDRLKEINSKLLRIKYKEWGYEDEARVVFEASEAESIGGLDFVKCLSLIHI